MGEGDGDVGEDDGGVGEDRGDDDGPRQRSGTSRRKGERGVVVLSLTVEWGVGMERQGPSYGEVVSTKDVRVQALLGRSNSPTSRSPEAVEWIMNVWITRCRTLLPVEGGGLYRVRQDPSQPT